MLDRDAAAKILGRYILPNTIPEALTALGFEENSASIAGCQLNMSIAEHIQRCEVLVSNELHHISLNNALIDVLCDSVRLAREYSEYAQRSQPDPRLAKLDEVERIAKSWRPQHRDAVICMRELCAALGIGKD